MTHFRTVSDTNIVIAAQNNHSHSPNREYFQRWHHGEFELLYSNDILNEYFRKLKECHISQEDIEELLLTLIVLAEYVPIRHFHLPHYQYPKDPDDIAFILCADNGKATHLLTYDSDQLKLDQYHHFNICKPIPFLQELRKTLKKNSEEI